jgi:23S rRNA (uracil1939-C5)-methyltransferase
MARVDGRVVFVQDTVPGDLVDLKVVRKRKNYYEAIPQEFLEYSSYREAPFCSHFGTCGGCKWQHMSYEAQKMFKAKHVRDCLERIGKIEIPEINPIIGSEKTRYYRNKLEFTFSNKRWLTSEEINSSGDLERNGLGFHIPGRFDKVLDIEHCYLQEEPSNSIRNRVRDFAIKNRISFYDVNNHEGILRNLIIRTANTGQVMVILQVSKWDDKVEMILEDLKEIEKITSLQYIINPKLNETFYDLDVHCYDGQPFIEEKMKAFGSEKILRFRIGPKSFFQTNSEQAEVLYQKAAAMAELKGKELVYDLYTGTGTIANYIAGKAGKVIGIESVPEAIEDAKRNSELNGIENTEFYAGDMKDLLDDSFAESHGKPDLIITDPPRAGMHEKAIEQMMKPGPDRIVYISCNPATQARDLALMNEKYRVVSVQPVDMFPQTHHIENIVSLIKR